MSKLEEKLQELGYEYNKNFMYYRKEINDHIRINIEVFKGQICDYRILDTKVIKTQEHIDNLQQAFNEMQKDLAILKEIEKDELEL